MTSGERMAASDKLLARVAAAVCAGAWLLFAAPCSAQQMQFLRGHVRSEVRRGTVAALGAVAGAKHMLLSIQLPLRNQAELTSFLGRLYDPASADFHKYLSAEEFTEKYGPAQEDYRAVLEFVKGHGMTVMDAPRNRMLVEVDATASQVNEALHVSMTEYQHPTEKRAFYSPDREPAIELSAAVLHISGLDNFTLPHPAQNSAPYPPNPTGSGPSNSYIPSDIRAAYYGNGPLDGSGQVVGVLEFDGYDVSDLNANYTSIGKTETVPVNNVLLGGLTAPMGDGGNDAEPVLDIVYAMSVAPNLSQVRVYECCSVGYDGSSSGPSLILNSMASENIAKQLSASWGWGPELSVDDPILQEMAAQGQTMFAASGDYGAPQDVGSTTYDDFYPADDAWLTSVGMSLLTTNGAGGAWTAEIYAGGSGGGYSDGPTPVPLPSYQVGVTNAANQASTIYRNVPDVVADGYGLYLCGMNQCNPGNGGSSFAAPIWASLMALANQQAAINGQPSVGFINPALYAIGKSGKYATDFHDIIGGNNGCCGQPEFYNAVTGYDLVSGWGAPNGPNLMDDLLAQTPGFTLLATESSISIEAGGSGTSTIMVAAFSGFAGNVTLAASGLPSGLTASFAGNPTSGSSVLTLSADGTASGGTSTVTISGTSGDITATTTVSVTVSAVRATFSLGSSAFTASLAAGGSTNVTITVASLNGFTAPVALSVSGLPSGVTGMFSASSVTPGAGGSATSILTLNASSSAAVRMSVDSRWGERYAAVLMMIFVPLGACFVRGRRKFAGAIFMVVIGVCLMLGFSSCGGGSPAASAPPMSSTVTVVGTSGTLTSSASFTLSVQ